MGNKNCEGLENQYQDTYKHPRLGQIARIQSSQISEQRIGYAVPIDSIKSLKRWQRSVQKLKNTICNDILFLPIEYNFFQSSLCGKVGQVKLIYKDYMFSLKDEIENRSKIRRPFKETQIWFILYKILQVSEFLSTSQMTIGDVRPYNIVVNQDGQINVISQYSWPKSTQTNNIFSKQINQGVFKAPEQLKIKKNNQIYQQTGSQVNHENYKSEIFSIGLTILQLCSLKQSIQIYDNKSINETNLKKHLQIATKRYSKDLIFFIKQMIKFSPIQRASSQQLITLLNPYSQKILNLTQFSFYSDKVASRKNTVSYTSCSYPVKSSSFSSSLPFTYMINNNNYINRKTLPVHMMRQATSSIYPLRKSYDPKSSANFRFRKSSVNDIKRSIVINPENRGQMHKKDTFIPNNIHFS